MRAYVFVPILAVLATCSVAQSASEGSQAMRVLVFPSDRPVGTLVSLGTPRPHAEPHDWWWGFQAGQFERLAPARGEFRAPDGMRVGLIVAKEEAENPAFLDKLPPDGLDLLLFPYPERDSVSAAAQIEHASRLTGLKTLILQGTIAPSQSLALLERLTSLERLALDLRQLDASGAAHLAGITTLQGLRLQLLDPAPPPRAVWSCLAGLSGLRELNVSGKACNADALSELARLPRLEVLYVGGGDCGGEGLAALAHFASLRRLEFYDLTDEGLKSLPPIPSLKELSIQGKHDGFTPEAFANLARQPTLEKLNLRGRFSDEAIGRLADMRTLKELGLHGLSQDTDYITDQALAHIGTMKSLESLLLYTGRFTDGALAHLASLDHLKRLQVPNNSFSDAGFRQIAKLHSLEELNIRSDAVTDEGVLAFAELTSLRKLLLSVNRHVSDDALAQLREKLPLLTIDADKPMKRARGDSPRATL